MPTIPPQEHRIYLEWLYLEPDGELSSAEQSELRRHLEGCAACRAERRDIAGLGRALTASRVEVEPSLERKVLENLPAAGWEARSPRAWKWAAACLAMLVAAAFLVGRTVEIEAGTSMAGVLTAVADLLAATAVAGAGLLTASWQGLGLALGQVFGGSKLTLGVFAVFVLGLDVLFVRYLLRRPVARLAERTASQKKR